MGFSSRLPQASVGFYREVHPFPRQASNRVEWDVERGVDAAINFGIDGPPGTESIGR